MMSPITVRADISGTCDVAQPVLEEAVPKEIIAEKGPLPLMEAKSGIAANRVRSGAVKVDAALQALNEHPAPHRSANHKSPRTDDDPPVTKREGRKNSSRRASEESVRSNGRKSAESGSRRSLDGSSNRKSTESQRSSATEPVLQDESSDQLSQITDILLARLITTLSDSTLGNPALLLQTLLGFSPDDYNDLLAALSESRLSYVDIISAYLHNIRVMSEDSGSTSAALSGTLTRSLIEQYNSLLAQAVKSPQSIARATLIGDTDGRSHLADLLKANSTESKPERRSFESLLPKGPSGLGFGRRHSAENKQRQQSLITPENKPTTQPTTDGGLIDFVKMFGNVSKAPVSDAVGNGNMGMQPQGSNSVTGITQEQLAAFLQSAGMMPNGGTAYCQQPANVPSLPFLPQTTGNSMNGMLAMNMGNPYAMHQMHQMQPWTVPMQQQMAGTVASRGTMGWQAATTVGFQQPGTLFRAWGGTGLETVPENFHAQIQQPDLTGFSQAINMPQHGPQ